MAVLIQADSVHYSYGTSDGEAIEALRGVHLQVEQGDYLALVGANGSGKSTLARCLCGLLQPTAGEVHVGGLSTRDRDAVMRIRTQMGMVFQNPENQFVTSSIEDEVAFGPENLGVPPAEIRRRVDAALEQVGLAADHTRDPRMLSAGEKARLAIATVLAMQPACLVLDEVTAMLDPLARRDTLNLVERLHAEGMTLIVVTHHMSEAVRACRVAVMSAGAIALAGSPAAVFSDAAVLSSLGLSLPPATAIARGLTRRGLALPADALNGEQLVGAISQLAVGGS